MAGGSAGIGMRDDIQAYSYHITDNSSGFGICAHLLQHGCEKLYLLGKKEEHHQEAEEGLKKYGDVSRVKSIQIEFEDLHHTDSIAKQLASKITRLDALILNAGLGVGVYNESKDGIDTHIQVNVFAQHHFMMTLLPVLRGPPDSRVVMQSSEFRRIGTSDVHSKNLAEINQDIDPSILYDHTKLG